MTDSAALTTGEPGAGPAPAQGGELFLARLRLICALAMAAAVFWYVGWWAVRPIDPQGPISLLMIDQGVIAMAKLLGLAVVTSGLAVAICGEGAAERGPLAIGVGLAALGLRGAQLDRLILYRNTLLPGSVANGGISFPTWELVAECWLWLALIAVGFVVGRWVESWSSPGRPSPPADQSSDVRQGLGTIAVTALVAWAVLAYSVGSDADRILKGQVYFAIGISFLVGGMVAHAVLRTTSRMWGLVAIPLVVSVAYLLGRPEDATLAVSHGAYVSLKPLAQPLPLEFAALGSVGILLETDAIRWLRSLFGLSTADRPS